MLVADSPPPGNGTALIVDVAGDVDGDGLADLLVPSVDTSMFPEFDGRTYVMLGTSSAPKP